MGYAWLHGRCECDFISDESQTPSHVVAHEGDGVDEKTFFGRADTCGRSPEDVRDNISDTE